MKIPKLIKRYCPHCKIHTEQKVKNEKIRGRNKARPLSKFSQIRLKLKGTTTGRGNRGRISRGALNSWKRFNVKHSKRTDLRHTCPTCNKTNTSGSRGTRSKKIQVE